MAITRTLQSGRYILGSEVTHFESEFAAYLGVEHAIGVGNGTDALYLALRACDIGTGDAVITVSHSAVATVAAIDLCGAVPILVDIEPATFTMDVARLREALASPDHSIKAIVPVHLYGHPARITEIVEVARDYGIWVIEDCAQAHGAVWHGRKVGTFGSLAAFSFYPTKNLGALGDGGAVVTDDTRLAERVRLLREYGWRERYVSTLAGVNTRLDELQAAILRVKLTYLDKDNERRIQLAQLYGDALAGHSGLTLPGTANGATHVYHQYVIRTAERESLRDHLRARGTGTLIHYPVPIHRQPAYAHLAKIAAPLLETERTVGEILSLPLFPELSEQQLATVIDQIRGWQSGRRRIIR